MKKITFFITATLFINLSLCAQGASQVAEQYRFFATASYVQGKQLAEHFTSFETTFNSVPEENEDELAVRALITTLETGWNNKSGATFSSVFADVHDYIVVNGMYMPNFTKKGNEAAHQGLFDGVFKNSDIKLNVDKLTFFRPELVQIIAIGGGYEKGAVLPEHPGIIMTVIAEKKKDTWKIISFHNHELNIEEIKQRGIPLNVMYASWYKK